MSWRLQRTIITYSSSTLFTSSDSRDFVSQILHPICMSVCSVSPVFWFSIQSLIVTASSVSSNSLSAWEIWLHHPFPTSFRLEKRIRVNWEANFLRMRWRLLKPVWMQGQRVFSGEKELKEISFTQTPLTHITQILSFSDRIFHIFHQIRKWEEEREKVLFYYAFDFLVAIHIWRSTE